jgi:RNA polymerase sigma-70 factor, ECF subfamily
LSEHVQAQDSLDDVPAAHASFDAEGLQELLATNQISPGCSAVLTLHFEEQMTLTEVAEALEIPLGTVKSRLAYGLTALRKRLGDRRNY